MGLREFNKEVLFATDRIVKVDQHDIEFLKERVVHNPRKRIRLCAHKDIKNILHEMIIVLGRDTYIRPHKHVNKSESFHIIEGSADVVVFDDEGNITEVIKMGNYSSGRRFYYRISEPYYHTVIINSEFLIYHETTNGPFDRSDTIFASWSPEENDSTAGKEFLEQLAQAVKNYIPLDVGIGGHHEEKT